MKRKERLNDDERRAQITLERQSRIDDNKISSTFKEKDMFLRLAVE